MRDRACPTPQAFGAGRLEPRSRPTSSAGTRCGRPTPCPSPLTRASCSAIAAGPARRRCAAPPSRGCRRRRPTPADVQRFFAAFPPLTPAGHAALAFALQASGRRAGGARGGAAGLDRRRAAARRRAARCSPRSAAASPRDDHDRRMEVLLGNGDNQSAARTLMWAPTAKRALYRGAARAADPRARRQRPARRARQRGAARRRA